MRTRLRLSLASAAAVALVVGAAGTAVADDIDASSDSSTFSVVGGVKTFVMEVGDTASVTITYGAETNDDGKNGCNLGGRSSQLGLDVLQTAAPSGGAGIAGLPSTLTLTDCDDSESLTFTASSPGTTTVTFPAATVTTNHDGVTPSSFDTSGSTFVVVVNAPEGRDAPAIANDFLHNAATADQLASCQAANGTNNGQTNWHGQLIVKVAQHFEGQTFLPEEEQVVVDYLLEQC